MFLAAAPSWAVNKCTLADGRVVYQDASCGNEVKSTEAVKTWVSNGIEPGARSRSSRDVAPNLKLAGPAQAKGLLDLYRRWADADRLARTTGRIALAGPVANLQSLQREAEAVVVPECLFPASKALTTLITKSTEAIIEFMGKQEIKNMVYEIVDKPKLIPEFENAVSTARCG
ncbi:hypothetical protein HNP55_003548 [Paucibacter oligotrophus]|uniref:DUF4124 domain-containing protein n=1 Tax=Roseateles oligotrophus TaxID=1769250 RepID=A0A840LED9_9BURK|nr:hypothetical protein [Roseateles oligotrophus]